MISAVYFSLFASIALGCGLYLLVAKHPLYGALALIGNMIALAGIYSLLSAPFLGVVQILTYAGAIMMLMVFVIMVLNTAHDHAVPRFDIPGVLLLVVPAGMALLLLTLVFFNSPTADPSALRGSAQNISAFMFDTTRPTNGYWILFEFIGLLLLGAMASAVLIAKKRLSTHKEDV